MNQIKQPSPGQMWNEQGGVYIGVCPGQNGLPDYHLILPIHPDAKTSAVAWGSRGINEPEAACEWDGMANTHALCISGNDHPAAKLIADLEIEGRSDFYLPARRELALCQAVAREHFERDWHWSSTQSSAGDAFCQYFFLGLQDYGSETVELLARPVRRLLIIQ